MDRDEWLGWLQEFLEDRIKDAPDETCKVLVENMWEETANLTIDDD